MRKTLLLIIITLHSFLIFPCTTFVIKTDGDLIFGRNLDWVSNNGLIVVNKRGMQKQSLVFPPEKPTLWTSKFGSITFNQFGKEFPFGGINEKGLVVEIMLADAQYPGFDDRTALNELQWIQYQLDNSKTINDVIKSDSLIRISKINQDLHFLLCDSMGNTAVIEFANGKMKVYQGGALPISILENDLYAESLRKIRNDESCRFGLASEMINEYDPLKHASIVDYSFSILDKVAIDGAWSIVYDIKNMQIHFKTSSQKKIRNIDISTFDFNCNIKSKIYHIRSKDVDNITGKFISYSTELNKEIFMDAIQTNSIYLPDDILTEFYSYNEKCICTY